MKSIAQHSVHIIGGGLAGLAAATAVAARGWRVTILEARNRLGGRAGSFQDPTTGELIDTCQHVSMRCCTNFAHFCWTVGIGHFLAPHRRLTFQTSDRRRSRFQAHAWPAPFHLLSSFASMHTLSAMEKMRIGWGLLSLWRTSSEDDPPFREWLAQHHQTPRTVERFWGLVLVSALNETSERIGLRYARKVFVDAFLRHPRGFELEMPTVPLGRLYGDELIGWLNRFHAEVHFQCAAKEFEVRRERVVGLEMRSGEMIKADWFIAAVPFDRLLDLLPDQVLREHACFRDLRNLETSPITSVHCWFDRPVLDLPHVVLVDCLGQWIFNRGANERGEYYVQVVVSAARNLREMGQEETKRRIVAELRQLFPPVARATLRRARVVTEHAATFSAVPGVDRWRPTQTSPLTNLFVAGDWTATGWPATMEGAVRSGYLAAEALMRATGRDMSLIRPDLR